MYTLFTITAGTYDLLVHTSRDNLEEIQNDAKRVIENCESFKWSHPLEHVWHAHQITSPAGWFSSEVTELKYVLIIKEQAPGSVPTAPPTVLEADEQKELVVKRVQDNVRKQSQQSASEQEVLARLVDEIKAKMQVLKLRRMQIECPEEEDDDTDAV